MPDDAVVVEAPAKINLWLRVLAREAGGYHQIETLFCSLTLADTVEVTPARSVELEIDGPRPGPPAENLAVRAAQAYLAETGSGVGARIRLRKKIPAGAGLGGGSSDAAATLRALNRIHDEALPEADLLRIGGALGSDVPFFLCGSSLALAWGRGDRLLPLPPLPGRPLLIGAPDFRVDTAHAYGWLDEDAETEAGDPRQPELLALDALRDWDGLAPLAANHFETPVFRRHPELGELRDALDHAGARIARLAGSGSCVFGLFDSQADRDEAAISLARRFPETDWIHAATAGPR